MVVIQSIRLAIPKGNRAVSALFRGLNFSLPDDFNESRKYIVPIDDRNVELILVKPIDIPTYVEYGAADLGIVGKEVLMEEARDVYELLDLRLSDGSLSVLSVSAKTAAHPRIATAYPYLAHKYCKEKGMLAKIIKLSGELELALKSRIADCIIEVHNQQNLSHLYELDRICSTSLRLIANRASFQLNNIMIQDFSEELISYSG